MKANRKALWAALASVIVMTAQSSFANPTGLNESVWHGIPEYQTTPSSSTIAQEMTYIDNTPAAYTFVNTVDGFNYGKNDASTIGQWFGADASGAALTDNNSLSYFAFNAVGYFYAPTAGSYTFDLGDTFNQVDDAASISIDGSLLVEQNYADQLSPYDATVTLSAGEHSFDLFYFQTGGGYSLDVGLTGPGGAPISFTTTESGGSSVPDSSGFSVVLIAMASVLVFRSRRIA